MGRYRRRWSIIELARIDVWHPQLANILRMLSSDVSMLPLEVAGRKVEVHLTPCRFGGRRPWLGCPLCGFRRRLTLYRHPQDGYWACRKCLHLVYPSQRASRDVLWTGQLAVTKLCRRFEPSWEYGDDYPSKPARVRWRTWEQFCEAVEQWESILEADLWQRVRRITRERGSGT